MNVITAMEEYRAAESETALDKVREYVSELQEDSIESFCALQKYGKAIAFLFTIEEENYKERLGKIGQQILSLKRKNGMFWIEGLDEETLFYQVLPVYALYETKLNKKEHYADIISLCKEAVAKYPGSELVFAGLAETLEYMSEEIYEQYAALYQLLKLQYKSVCAEKNTSAIVSYALAKACFYKAFLEEKYAPDIKGGISENEKSEWQVAATFAYERLMQKLYGRGLD